jgi:HEPN domain-containing protein
MLDDPEFRRWREAAENARQAARLQREHPEFANWSCFLAEQSAQLGLKALLHGVGAGAWGHDLVELGAALVEATATALPETAGAALQRLSRHYIPARYPDAYSAGSPAGHYGSSDAELALEDLNLVLELVDSLWSQLGALGEDERRGP